ncbi:hypothetical protein TRICI_002745 [Trichomonascus ciferrii]|uniref:Uncharacterized protein n=1 Tax=Trichomonascus ciferrii TaxID=44093 RepID=A0A642V5S7_9ASCO|nr:hypothetical protein TRICI_002745 [Trichomonascus ciferrii]
MTSDMILTASQMASIVGREIGLTKGAGVDFKALAFYCFYSLKPPRAPGVQGASPLQNPNPVVFWGHAPRPPGLASLEVMGKGILVEASQSHGSAGGRTPAKP